MLHLTPEQLLLTVLITFTLIVVSIDVLLSCAIHRELVRQGRVQPPPQPQDPYALRVQRLGARLDDAISRPWSMSVQPRNRSRSDDAERA